MVLKALRNETTVQYLLNICGDHKAARACKSCLSNGQLALGNGGLQRCTSECPPQQGIPLAGPGSGSLLSR